MKNLFQNITKNIFKTTVAKTLLTTSATFSFLNFYLETPKVHFQSSKMENLEEEGNLSKIEQESFCIKDKDGRVLGNAVRIADDYLLVWETNGLIIDTLRKHEVKLFPIQNGASYLNKNQTPYEFYKYFPDENLVILKIGFGSQKRSKDQQNVFQKAKIGEKVLVFGNRRNNIPCFADTRINNFLVDNINYKVPTTLTTFSINLGSSNLKSNESFLVFNKNLEKVSLCKTFDGNTGFCINPAQIRSLEYLLRNKNEVERPYLGLSVKSVGNDGGVFIFKVSEASPAQRGGFKMGDTLVELDGFSCLKVSDFFSIIGFSTNRKIEGVVTRDGKLEKVLFDL